MKSTLSGLLMLSFCCSMQGQQTSAEKFTAAVASAIAPAPKTIPLYENGTIPNSKASEDQEHSGGSPVFLRDVSNPTIQIFLPAKAKANGASIIIFPGGGYAGLSIEMEGGDVAKEFQDHGYAAFVVKYRLPSDRTMEDKSIGPLQDAQQAMRLVRGHAVEWNIDPHKIGVIGFSAGGHLASTLVTHFDKAYIANPEQISLRPDFMILVYPVISMNSKITHMGSRVALLGEHPAEERLRLFSNETQVTEKTPPTLILQATDDHLVDVENSVVFFEALRQHDVPVEMAIFEKGEHGFFLLPRDEWHTRVFSWLARRAEGH